jgi:hypothetical protein
MQCVEAIIVTYGLPGSAIFSQIIKSTVKFSKKTITEYKMCGLIFSTIFSQTFHIPKRNERDIIKN